MKEAALITASVIFFLVSIMHLLRLLFNTKVTIGTFVAPLWLSAVGLIVSLLLSLWMFKASR